MKKINWLDHLVNLVVVITGISIAFGMNNWKDSNKTADLKTIYVASMTDEIEADIEDLDSLIYNDSIKQIVLYKLYLSDSIPLTPDSISWALEELGSWDSFTGHNITYESLKSSGKFEIIDDVQLRLDILDNYHNKYRQIVEIENYFRNNFDENILPYFIDELGVSLDSDSFSITPRLKNIIGLHVSFLTQKMEAYRSCKEQSEKLVVSLKSLD